MGNRKSREDFPWFVRLTSSYISVWMAGPDDERAQCKDKCISPDSNPSECEDEDAMSSIIARIGSRTCASITNRLASGDLAPAG